MKKNLIRTAILLSVVGQFGCNDQNTNVTPNGPQLGTWQIEHYNTVDAVLVGLSEDAKTICDYKQGNAVNTVLLDVTGSAWVFFRENGTNKLFKPDGGV